MFVLDRKIQESLIDCVELIANAMRSGLSLSQAFALAGRELSPPLNAEFMRVQERMSLGFSLDEALLESEARIKIPDFSWLVYSMLILKQGGGNFVAHFEKLSQILRERERVSQKISLLTAQGMAQGVLLSLMPLGLGLLLLLTAPQFLSPLWETKPGWFFLFLIFTLDAGGFFWMRKWAKVEV